MRFIIIHKTHARWEACERPSPELVARVGALIGDMNKANAFVDGAGLRATSEGVRVRFVDGARTVIPGPFPGDHELPAGFTIVRAPSLEAAVESAARQARVLGDVEIDIRPVTEAWDIGIGQAPADLRTRRYMLLRKATPATESGDAPSAAERAHMTRIAAGDTPPVEHLQSESMRPSRRGRRYRNTRDGVTALDGPFTETKELIAGYVIVSAASLDEASAWAPRYLETVEADEVDVRELE